jgi:hypothetical protein
MAALIAFSSTTAFAQKGGNPNPRVTPPDSGQYAELSAQWWQWALSQPVTNNPATTNPLVDTTGAAAHNGQPEQGNVFFLAGLISFNAGLVAQAERTITIPTGTRLFFPILNSEQDNVGVNPPLSVAELRALAAFGVNSVTSLFATIDGVPSQDLTAYRAISPVFSYTLPPNNVAGNSVNIVYAITGGAIDVTGVQKPAVADGFYLLLTPLTPGHHDLHFGGTTSTLDANGNPATFQLDITYHITVKPGH